MKPKKLNKVFFNRPAPQVAQDLLGKYLVRKVNGTTERYKITEVEAYEGVEDLASHASKGRTQRTEIMFGEAGRLYIYFIYGMYYMLNVVTGSVGHPAAVLIRGVEGINGPGRLTKKLQIDKQLNGLLQSPDIGLWFEDQGNKISEMHIQKSARIGVAYAGPIWAKKEYRFTIVS